MPAAPAAATTGGEMYAPVPESEEAEALLAHAPRRRDASAPARPASEGAGLPPPGRQADAVARRGGAVGRAGIPALLLFFGAAICYLTSTGVRGDLATRQQPAFARYVPSEPALADEPLLFAVARRPAGCGAPARVECVVGGGAAVARTLDSRAHALGTLLPCWSLFRRHPAARRVLVLQGGVRLGSDSYAPLLLRRMRADVLLEASEPSGQAGSGALPADACAVRAERRGPARTGWPAAGAPPPPSDAALRAAAAAATRGAGGEGGVSEIAIDPEDWGADGDRGTNLSLPLLSKLLRSVGPVRYASDASDVPALAALLAPDASGAGAEPAANLSLQVGLLEPERGLAIARAPMLRRIGAATLGPELRVRQGSLARAAPAAQAAFVRAHGLLIVSHGAAGSEALLYVRRCTAVLELYPDFSYRPGLLLPLVLAAGGLAFAGTSAPEPERHTWQRLAAVGALRAEEALRPPPILPPSLAAFLPQMVAAREACLAGGRAGTDGGASA